MDYSDEYTEAKLDALEKKLNRTYKRAWNELQGECEDYFEQFADRYHKEYQAYKQGKYTKEQFQNWYLSQVARGKQWEAKRNSMAWMMEKTNETACQLINGTTPSVYALNANYLAYLTEQDYDVSFNLIDESTVKNLVMENGNNVEFKTVSINPKRDYKWNANQIQSALVSGILQGESVDKLAESFMVVQGRNKNAAIRNARTCITSAQNAGRIETMKKSQEMGIDVKKQWLSAHDSRTRDSHAVLDGQIRDIDKPFDNGLQYPGDSDGEPAEVYNCRCTLKYVYPKYQDVASRELYTDTKSDGESYQEWLKRRKQGAKDSESLKGKYRTTIAQRKVAQKLDKDISSELGVKSYWTGKVKRGINSAPPNYNIMLEGNCIDKTIVHELTHLHSYARTGHESYMAERGVEESTVEFFAREYAKRNNMIVGDLKEDTYLLTMINREYNLYSTDYEFAKELLKVDLPMRYEWLLGQMGAKEVPAEVNDFVYSRIHRVIKDGVLDGEYELFRN